MASYKGKYSKNAPGGYQQFLSHQKTGEFPRLNIFTGDEKFLLYWCRDRLKKLYADGPAADFNYHRFDADSFSLDLFQSAVESPPMMAEYTFIELNDINLFDSSIDRNQLAEILLDIPEYCMILSLYDTVTWKPDKRAKKLWNAIEQNSEVYEFAEQSESELVKWIQKRFASDHISVDASCAKHLILQAGSSMQNLSSEIDKLKTYLESDTLTKADIDAVVIPVLSAAIYTITEAISNRDFDSALGMLRNVLSQDIDPLRVSAAIGGQMRQLYAAKLLAENRRSAYDLGQLYNLYERRANTIFAQAKNFKRSQLKAAIELCAEADLKLKSFSGDDQAVVIDLLLNISRLQAG